MLFGIHISQQIHMILIILILPYTINFIRLKSVGQLYNLQLLTQLFVISSISLAKVHLHTTHQSIHYLTYNLMQHKLFIILHDASQLRFNFHIGTLFGFFSIMWCGHLVHVAIPASRGGQSSLAIYPFFNCNWSLYSTPKDNKNHIFSASRSSNINISLRIKTRYIFTLSI
jgi:hypothetical protein